MSVDGGDDRKQRSGTALALYTRRMPHEVGLKRMRERQRQGIVSTKYSTLAPRDLVLDRSNRKFSKPYLTTTWCGDPAEMASVASFRMADGTPAVDVVMVFAANLSAVVTTGHAMLNGKVAVPEGYPLLNANAAVIEILTSGVVAFLQQNGIRVVLSVIGERDEAGWSSLSDPAMAQNVADQCADCCREHGLNGIDIDDEFSTVTPNASITHVSTLMRRNMPHHLITQNLWNDVPCFDSRIEGVGLADNLDLGFDIAFGEATEATASKYIDAGVDSRKLLKGFYLPMMSQNIVEDVAHLKTRGMGGVAVFDWAHQATRELTGLIVGLLHGPGNWVSTDLPRPVGDAVEDEVSPRSKSRSLSPTPTPPKPAATHAALMNSVHLPMVPRHMKVDRDRQTKPYITAAFCDDPTVIEDVAKYRMQDGQVSVDIVMIFAANLNRSATMPSENTPLNGYVEVEPDFALLNGNPKIMKMLTSGVVSTLRSQGIKVLLSVLGNHDRAGWSSFDSRADAQCFAEQCLDCCRKYGLDGIDIDDEYTSPDLRLPGSLAMVTTLMRRIMPNYLITKDLWVDAQYFDAEFEGSTLADNLDFGFEMSYGSSASNMHIYEEKGMSPDSLCKGFWENQLPYGGIGPEVQLIKDRGYRGVSVFIWQTGTQAVQVTKDLQTELYGEGNFEEVFIKSVRPPMRLKSPRRPLLHEKSVESVPLEKAQGGASSSKKYASTRALDRKRRKLPRSNREFDKEFVTATYSGSPSNIASVASYRMADGSPAVDVVMIFAANLNTTPPTENTHLNGDVAVPQGYPILNANPAIWQILTSGIVDYLTERGVRVVLSVLGNWDSAGWSNFSDEATALNFAEQCLDCCERFGLAGIDIDDEYSQPDLRLPGSLVLVTSIMRDLMPNYLITKDLYSDINYFDAELGGRTLADNLDFGWEMTYWAPPESTLPQYAAKGMSSRRLAKGFWPPQSRWDAAAAVAYLREESFRGVSTFDWEAPATVELTGALTELMYGAGNWLLDPVPRGIDPARGPLSRPLLHEVALEKILSTGLERPKLSPTRSLSMGRKPISSSNRRFDKEYITATYSGSPSNIASVASRVMADGKTPSVDIVMIFAANLNTSVPSGNTRLNGDVFVPAGYPVLNANPEIWEILTSGVVKHISDMGVRVVLTVLGNWDSAGWSNFSDEATARNFAEQCLDCCERFGLAGIDIDDEYSQPDLHLPGSLAMVTSIMRDLMPHHLITKDLFSDLAYFDADFNGRTLADNLDFGWEMTYWRTPQATLPAYLARGMSARQLAKGFWPPQSSAFSLEGAAAYLREGGFRGVSTFDWESERTVECTGALTDLLYGAGNWNDVSDTSAADASPSAADSSSLTLKSASARKARVTVSVAKGARRQPPSRRSLRYTRSPILSPPSKKESVSLGTPRSRCGDDEWELI